MVNKFNNKWQLDYSKSTLYNNSIRSKLLILNSFLLYQFHSVHSLSMLDLTVKYLSAFVDNNCLAYSTTNSIRSTTPVNYYGKYSKFKKSTQLSMVEPNDN